MNTQFHAWPDYGKSREHIVISARPSCAYLGYVQAWTGYAYWPVHDANDTVVAYVRRELGGLYADEATKAESIRWAARVLMDRAADESRSARKGSEKSGSLRSDHRGFTQARSSESGNDGQAPAVTIQSREPVSGNGAPVGRASPERLTRRMMTPPSRY